MSSKRRLYEGNQQPPMNRNLLRKLIGSFIELLEKNHDTKYIYPSSVKDAAVLHELVQSFSNINSPYKLETQVKPLSVLMKEINNCQDDEVPIKVCAYSDARQLANPSKKRSYLDSQTLLENYGFLNKFLSVPRLETWSDIPVTIGFLVLPDCSFLRLEIFPEIRLIWKIKIYSVFSGYLYEIILSDPLGGIGSRWQDLMKILFGNCISFGSEPDLSSGGWGECESSLYCSNEHTVLSKRLYQVHNVEKKSTSIPDQIKQHLIHN